MWPTSGRGGCKSSASTLTAGHVLRSAAALPVMGIGFVSGKRWLTRRCGAHEILESHDVGIFEAEGIEATPLPWLSGELPITAPVLSVGFPYGLNRDISSIDLRAFRGHVVSAASNPVLPAKPRVYELQFQCPRGLSSAPLIFESSGLFAAGVVVGNATTQMLVLSDREVFAEGATTIFERYEMLQLGIAAQSDALRPLKSELLGATLQEHLASHGLVRAAV
jgi:hypothetical protein